MLIREIICEGGWANKITQGTVITPGVVKSALQVAEKFIRDFNSWLEKRNIAPTKLGTPTGSTAYHHVDPEDKVYGDIDLQIVVPEIQSLADKSQSQKQAFWYNLADEFVKQVHPPYIHPESTAGHPIFKVGTDDWVQIDLMPHTPDIAGWGSARAIPERGVKGALHGNIYSVLGELLKMSIQYSGVQFKSRGGIKQPFTTTRTNYELETLTKNPETFIRDIFDHECAVEKITDPKIHPLLVKHPGKDIADVKISNLVNGVKGLAYSFEMNGMFGRGDLADYSNAEDFLQKFWKIYQAKAMKDLEATKRDKAETPAAKERAEQDRKKILTGLEKVRDLFA